MEFVDTNKEDTEVLFEVVVESYTENIGFQVGNSVGPVGNCIENLDIVDVVEGNCIVEVGIGIVGKADNFAVPGNIVQEDYSIVEKLMNFLLELNS